MNHLKEKTHQYLDVIELAYYCLITGFEGENHALADGQQTLGNLIEELHQLINQHRVYKPHQAIHTLITPPHSTTVNRHSLWAAVFATIALVFALGLFSHMGLSQKAQAILQTHDATSVQ